MATEQQGIMSLPQGGQEAAPQLSIDDSQDAIMGALQDANPEASGQLQQLMAQLTPMLDQLPDEQLDAMIQIFQYLHDHPEEYAEKVADLVQHGVIDEGMLPEKYDPELIAALGMVFLQAKKERQAGNSREMMAQMPMPPATMARGGIAEAARMVASQGRNRDTMLAHITPQEARMLRKKGGTGTINPATGLPEYGWWTSFRDTVTAPARAVVSVARSVTSAVADAVKPILSSPIGRVLATAALATFIGPAAFGVTGAAGLGLQYGLSSAIITGLSGGSFKDMLKSGATSFFTAALAPTVGGAAGSALGVTSAAGQAALGAGITGAGIAKLSGQSLQDSIKSGLTQGVIAGAINLGNQAMAPVPGGAPVEDAVGKTPAQIAEEMANGAGNQPTNPTGAPAGNAPPPAAANAAPGTMAQGPQAPAAMAPVEDMQGVPVQRGAMAQLKGGISDLAQGNYQQGLEGIKGGLGETFFPTSKTNLELQQTPEFLQARASGATYTEALKQASSAYNPGLMRTYGPWIGAGLGAAALAGGFKPTPLPPSALAEKLAGDPGQALIDANPSRYYVQGLSGVKYDDRGSIVGSNQNWGPVGSMEDVRRPMPGTSSTFMPSFYNTPQNSVTQQQGGVYQPYNNANMYSFMQSPYNFLPRYAADGGMMDAMAPPSEGGVSDQGIASLQSPVHLAWGGSLFGGSSVINAVRQALSGTGDMLTRTAQPVVNAIKDFTTPTPTPAPTPAPALTARSVQTATPTIGTAPVSGSTGLSSLMARMYPSLYNSQFQQRLQRGRSTGLATLAEGGYPRRTGQISGPGTERSDSIPAMLSDGEFVMTAKAVRGAGKGDRRAGAKKMYALMHQLERNASRG